MLQPLQQFICDQCHKIIKRPEDGEIVWQQISGKTFRTAKYGDYRLVHKLCGIRMDYMCNASFDHFFDCFLLKPHAADIQEYMELMRRLTVLYYEVARLYMQREGTTRHFYNDINKLMPNSRYYETIVALSEDEW